MVPSEKGSRIVLAACVAIAVYAQAARGHPPYGHPSGDADEPWAETTQWLELPSDNPDRFDVWVRLGDTPRLLHLQRLSLRAPTFRARAWLPDGRTLVIAPLASTTYRGWVEADARLSVVASLRANGLQARILDDTGTPWKIDGLSGARRGSGGVAHRVREGVRAVAGPPLDETSPVGGGPALSGGASGISRLAEIAFDLDHTFYVANGSTIPDAVAAAEALLNEVEFFFARDALVRFAITDIIVRTSPFYPANGVFQAFQTEWNANQTGVPRDLAHLLVNLGTAGAGRVSSACDLTRAYGYSSGGPEPMGHELGHIFGVPTHCHDWIPCNVMCTHCLALGPKTRDLVDEYCASVTCLDEVGPYTAPLPPYAYPDIAYLTRDEIASGSPLEFAAVDNDHDGNLDPLSLDGFDSASAEGGVVSDNGSLVYTPPAAVFPGSDHFTYQVSDGTGFETTGRVEVRVAAPGLVGYWKLDQNTDDSSGGGRNGVIYGGANFGGGVYDAGLKFDGADDYLLIRGFDRDMPAVTISSWIQRSGIQNPFAGVLVSHGPNTSAGLRFGVANELRYLWGGDPATEAWNSGLVVPDSQWVFVALVVEPSQATIYLHDGASMQSAVHLFPHETQDFGDFIWLGWDTSGASRHFSGTLDDVRFHDYALSATEIADLRERGGKAYAPTPPDSGGTIRGLREISWSPGLAATSHHLYFGSDYVAVRDAGPSAPEYCGNLASAMSTAPLPLVEGATYYWRVDEVTASALVRGDVWVFSVDAPLARWTLDEPSGSVAEDSAGSHDGTFLGRPLLDQAPAQLELGRAVYFDGLDDSVEIPPLGLARNEVTITAWVRRNGTQANMAGLFYTRSPATMAGLNMDPSGNLRFSWIDTGLFDVWQSSNLQLPDNDWALTALVVAPDKLTVYLGKQGAISSYVAFHPQDREEFDGPFHLGRDPLGARHFRGHIDDVRIYPHSISRAELTALYSTGVGAGRVQDGMVLGKLPDGRIQLTWLASCVGGDGDYAIYEGTIGDYSSHLPVTCGTGGAVSNAIQPGSGNHYYLVVPQSSNREGSYGTDSAGVSRAQSSGACRFQFSSGCP